MKPLGYRQDCHESWIDTAKAPAVCSHPGDHIHTCGVKGCGNYYRCHVGRCAGAVWICPACEMDEQDEFYRDERLIDEP